MSRGRPQRAEAPGFTMVEVLFVMLIMTLSLSLFSAGRSASSLHGYMRQIQLLAQKQQNLALSTRSRQSLSLKPEGIGIGMRMHPYPNGISCQPVSFSWNASGNISRAGTIRCNDGTRQSRIVFQLGSGRSRIETDAG